MGNGTHEIITHENLSGDISKSSHRVLHFVTAYLQVRNELAGDRPRRDFWLVKEKHFGQLRIHTIFE